MKTCFLFPTIFLNLKQNATIDPRGRRKATVLAPMALSPSKRPDFASAYAWANAAQESAGAAFRKAAQVWPGPGGTGPGSSPFESDEPFQGSLGAVRIRVCTWNLHGNPIDASDDVKAWLMPENDVADVVVIAVQELVDLGPKNMVLNTNGDEQRQMALEQRVEGALSTGGRFIKVCGFGMVGLALLIYVQPWVARSLRQLRIDRVKTGLDGIGGNKGGVCARFLLGHMSVCFVNVHLASGQNAVVERSQHLAQVLSGDYLGTDVDLLPRILTAGSWKWWFFPKESPFPRDFFSGEPC